MSTNEKLKAGGYVQLRLSIVQPLPSPRPGLSSSWSCGYKIRVKFPLP